MRRGLRPYVPPGLLDAAAGAAGHSRNVEALDGDEAMLGGKPVRDLVQRVAPAPDDPGAQPCDPLDRLSAAGGTALLTRELLLQRPMPTALSGTPELAGHEIAVGGRHEGAHATIHAYGWPAAWSRRLRVELHAQREVPADRVARTVA